MIPRWGQHETQYLSKIPQKTGKGHANNYAGIWRWTEISSVEIFGLRGWPLADSGSSCLTAPWHQPVSADCRGKATADTLRCWPWKPTILKQEAGRNWRHLRLKRVKQLAKIIQISQTWVSKSMKNRGCVADVFLKRFFEFLGHQKPNPVSIFGAISVTIFDQKSEKRRQGSQKRSQSPKKGI